MTLIRIDVNDRAVTEGLRELQRIAGDLRPALAEIGATLESRIHQRFDLKEAPEGTPWPDWSPVTAARRAAEGRGSLLEHTRRMRDSLSYLVESDAVLVGFGRPYAVYHETGTRRMPRRGLLATEQGELAPDDRDAILDVIEDHLRRVLG